MFVSIGNIYITLPPRNTTAVEGSRVRLQCQAEGYPDNITYRWYRNDIDVQLIPGFMQVIYTVVWHSYTLLLTALNT
jgi:Immunoglobulin domain